MRIAVIVPGFSAHEGDWCVPAITGFVRTLAGRAVVDVYALRWPERGGDYTAWGARVRAMDGRKRMGLRAIGLWRRTLGLLRESHRQAPYDAVHAFWADEPAWIAVGAGARLRVPVIVSLAGGELVALKDIGYGLGLLPLRTRLVRYALNRATLVTGGSRYLLDQARAFLGDQRAGRLRSAPLGVDTRRFSPAPAAVPRRAGPVLLNVGSLSAVKGQRALIDLLPRLPDAVLRIAGSGPLAALLGEAASRAGMSGRVAFLGEVPHDDMPAVYHGADLLVQTSRHEAQGMAVLEAAACGVPSAGTATGILPEIGIAVPRLEDLCRVVGGLVADRGALARRGREARAAVEALYTLEAAAERFRRLYEEAVALGAMRS
jgi:glycosyltransferase involved in cell wall biosynthesis